MLLISNQYNYNTAFGTKQIPRDELEALLKKDKTIAQIAKKFNVSTDTIRLRIKQYDFTLPSEKLRERYQNEALPLIQQGVSFANVRKMTGISEEYCYQQMKKNKSVNPRQVRNEMIEKLYYEGKSDKQIGEIVSLHESTVKHIRMKRGWVKFQRKTRDL